MSTDLLLLVCFKRVCVSRIDCVTPFSTAELCVVADVLDCIHKHENCVTIRACLWLNPVFFEANHFLLAEIDQNVCIKQFRYNICIKLSHDIRCECSPGLRFPKAL